MIASEKRRMTSLATDRGCNRPGCTVAGLLVERHDVDGWTADNEATDITKLTLPCGPDDRLVEQGHGKRKRADGRTEWIPPPRLDTGQTRVNDYHYPHNHLVDSNDDEVP